MMKKLFALCASVALLMQTSVSFVIAGIAYNVIYVDENGDELIPSAYEDGTAVVGKFLECKKSLIAMEAGWSYVSHEDAHVDDGGTPVRTCKYKEIVVDTKKDDTKKDDTKKDDTKKDDTKKDDTKKDDTKKDDTKKDDTKKDDTKKEEVEQGAPGDPENEGGKFPEKTARELNNMPLWQILKDYGYWGSTKKERRAQQDMLAKKFGIEDYKATLAQNLKLKELLIKSVAVAKKDTKTTKKTTKIKTLPHTGAGEDC